MVRTSSSLYPRMSPPLLCCERRTRRSAPNQVRTRARLPHHGDRCWDGLHGLPREEWHRKRVGSRGLIGQSGPCLGQLASLVSAVAHPSLFGKSSSSSTCSDEGEEGRGRHERVEEGGVRGMATERVCPSGRCDADHLRVVVSQRSTHIAAAGVTTS